MYRETICFDKCTSFEENFSSKRKKQWATLSFRLSATILQSPARTSSSHLLSSKCLSMNWFSEIVHLRLEGYFVVIRDTLEIGVVWENGKETSSHRKSVLLHYQWLRILWWEFIWRRSSVEVYDFFGDWIFCNRTFKCGWVCCGCTRSQVHGYDYLLVGINRLCG